MEEKRKEMQRTEERGFFWHWQNLKEDSPTAWLHGRAWLHKRPRGVIGFEWCLPGKFGMSITVGGHHQLLFTLQLLLFSFYLHIDEFKRLRWCDYGEQREIGFHWFMWSLNWRIWTNPDEWHSTTPKWRDGHFNIPDFLFGRYKYTKVDQEPILVTIPMPEGNYQGTVTFFSQTWQRKRFPYTKQRTGAEVDIEGGIPIPGKGENAWDCDDSAFLSIGTSASTVEEAVQHAIETVNKRRERYGGKNWLPERVK